MQAVALREDKLLDWDVREYQSIDSTNLEARRLLAEGAAAGLVVWARHQTAGRGRLDRQWFDLPGKSLMASLVLDDLKGFLAGMLASLSIRAAIRSQGGQGPGFKWPNDLVYGWRKAGGILSESCHIEGKTYIITGLGLNVGYLPEELDFPSRLPATSLLIEERKEFDLQSLLLAMIEELDERKGCSDHELLEEYRRHLACLGEEVCVHPPFSVIGHPVMSDASLQGIIEGIDGEGNLLLRVGDEVMRLASGDPSPHSRWPENAKGFYE